MITSCCDEQQDVNRHLAETVLIRIKDVKFF